MCGRHSAQRERVRIVERGCVENGGGEENRSETNNIIVRGQRKYLSFKVHGLVKPSSEISKIKQDQ